MQAAHSDTVKLVDSKLKDELYKKIAHFERRDFLDVISSAVIYPGKNDVRNIQKFLNSIKSDVLNEVTYQIAVKKTIEWKIILRAKLVRKSEDKVFTSEFESGIILSTGIGKVPSHIENSFTEIINSFTQLKSEWRLEKVMHIHIVSVKCVIASNKLQ